MLSALSDAGSFVDGEVLVTRMTAPDWVPLMRRAAAIATDSGGMTCHAAIVSRELGIPCVVGTQTATQKLRNGEIVTVDATRGVVLEGAARNPSEAPAAHRRLTGSAGAGDRHQPAAQPLRAVPGGARRSSSTSTASACSVPR